MRSSTRHSGLSVPDQERRRHGRYRRLRRADQFDGRIGVTVRPVRRTPPHGTLAHRDPIQPRRHRAVADRGEAVPREPVHPRTRARRGCRSPQGPMSWRCGLRPTVLPSLSGASGVVVRRRGRRRCRRGSGDRRRRGCRSGAPGLPLRPSYGLDVRLRADRPACAVRGSGRAGRRHGSMPSPGRRPTTRIGHAHAAPGHRSAGVHRAAGLPGCRMVPGPHVRPGGRPSPSSGACRR